MLLRMRKHLKAYCFQHKDEVANVISAVTGGLKLALHAREQQMKQVLKNLAICTKS